MLILYCCSSLLVHLVGAFDSEEVIHVEGDVNPVRDIEIINDELRLKDLEATDKELEKLGKTVNRGDKTHKAEYVSCSASLNSISLLGSHNYRLLEATNLSVF